MDSYSLEDVEIDGNDYASIAINRAPYTFCDFFTASSSPRRVLHTQGSWRDEGRVREGGRRERAVMIVGH